jgi:UDP-N-acetyl-D-mannosaminuronic acid dehydrogenase
MPAERTTRLSEPPNLPTTDPRDELPARGAVAAARELCLGHRHGERPVVAVIGLGYVGLTLAAALIDAGVTIVGYDTCEPRTASIRAGSMPFYEPGLHETVTRGLDEGSLRIMETLPARLPDIVVLCVGTPASGAGHGPDLEPLKLALTSVAPRLADGALVIVRSTVPVGTTRGLALPALSGRTSSPALAYCPERTIQGSALTELRMLPQIVGGYDSRSAELAATLFARLTDQVVRVSSLEAAEMVKLVCNAHTDVLYGFGNEVALLAEGLGLDAWEIIDAANYHYPRPDLHFPGYVGGSCLTKDPYFLLNSLNPPGSVPSEWSLVATARRLNEGVPYHIAHRTLECLEKAELRPDESTVLLCGIAYKGVPQTGDVRGCAAVPIAERLRPSVQEVLAQDFIVEPEVMNSLGFTSVSLEEGIARAQACVFVNNHPGYQRKEVTDMLRSVGRPFAVVDVWNLLDEKCFADRYGIIYSCFGHG